jgi:phosphate starvation-inducible PhoH-like protein
MPKPQKQKAPSYKQKDNLGLRTIRPLTFAQQQMFSSYLEHNMNLICSGSAGTGKTFLATYLALRSLFSNEVDKIIFVRSTVSVRDLGFLPGSAEEKAAPYFEIYKDAINFLCDSGTAYESLLHRGSIQLEPTSFVRGATWRNAVVLIDEYQNLNRQELYSVMTRLGDNSRLLILGDHKQTDLVKGSSHEYLMRMAEKLSDDFDTVNFTQSDIVRSPLVKAIIIADSEIL